MKITDKDREELDKCYSILLKTECLMTLCGKVYKKRLFRVKKGLYAIIRLDYGTTTYRLQSHGKIRIAIGPTPNVAYLERHWQFWVYD